MISQTRSKIYGSSHGSKGSDRFEKCGSKADTTGENEGMVEELLGGAGDLPEIGINEIGVRLHGEVCELPHRSQMDDELGFGASVGS